MILYRSAQIEIVGAIQPGDSAAVVILVSAIAAGKDPPARDPIEDFLRRQRRSAIRVTLIGGGPTDEAQRDSVLAAMEAETAGFGRRTVFASSESAAGGMRIARGLDADAALLIAPIDGDIGSPGPSTRLIIVEDPIGAGASRALLAGSSGDNGRLVMPLARRSIAAFLRGADLLFPMVIALLDDRIDLRSWRATARGARRTSLPYWSDLATALHRSHPAAAAEAASRAVALAPDNIDARALLARCLMAAGRLAEAVSATVQAMKMRADPSPLYPLLGDTLRAAGDHPRAITAYRHSLAANGPDRAVFLGLARSSAHVGDAAAVEAALQEARLNGANDGSIRKADFDAHRVMGPDGAPVLFATTPTSGTASMGRILRAIARGWHVVRVNSPAADDPGPDRTFLDPAAKKTIYWFQGGTHWNDAIDLSPFRAIVHLRDPRDLACNQFWWALQHPNLTDPPEVAAQWRRSVEAMGIDEYVFIADNSLSTRMIRQIVASPIGPSIACTSYAQLCCAFDLIIESLCDLFGTSRRYAADTLHQERPENVQANSQWIKVGGTWQGADISPGRFRRELRPETAERLTRKYAGELAMMRGWDAPFLAHHYE